MFKVKGLNAFKIVMAILILSLPLRAEVKVSLVANKILKTDGTEIRQSGERAKPGEVIEYVAEYRNTDKAPVHNVVATLPVPAGVEYLPDTAVPKLALASTDGVHFSAIPLKRTVRDAAGQATEELVPYSEYRSLRWNLEEISGGGSKTVKARMKVKSQEQ